MPSNKQLRLQQENKALLKLQQEKIARLRGYAKVRLEDLDFEQNREPDYKTVERLKNVFEEEGCDRANPANFLPALVKLESLQGLAVLADLCQFLDSMISAPLITLGPEEKLTCLHGKHRILAAKKVLCRSDQWWVVALYDDGMTTSPVTYNIGDNKAFRTIE